MLPICELQRPQLASLASNGYLGDLGALQMGHPDQGWQVILKEVLLISLWRLSLSVSVCSLAGASCSLIIRVAKNAHNFGVVINSPCNAMPHPVFLLSLRHSHLLRIYLGPSIRMTATVTSEKNENSAGATLHFETYAKAKKVTSLSIKRLSKTIWNDSIMFESAGCAMQFVNGKHMIKHEAASDFKSKSTSHVQQNLSNRLEDWRCKISSNLLAPVTAPMIISQVL